MKWTPKKDKILAKEYRKGNIKNLAAQLGCNINAIYRRRQYIFEHPDKKHAKFLNVLDPPGWGRLTDKKFLEEVDKLADLPVKALSRTINPNGRSKDGVEVAYALLVQGKMVE